MLDFHNERRCIFVSVCRSNQQLTVPPMPEVPVQSESGTPRPPPVTVAPPEIKLHPSGTPRKQPGKLMKPRAKSKSRAKSKEPKKDDKENIEKREEAKRQIVDEIVQNEISAVPNQAGALQLKWSNARKIPDDTDEFVFVVSRDAERMEEKNELDQSYFVGYCKSSRNFKRLLEICKPFSQF